MAALDPLKKTKRIAIAIAMDEPVEHHHGCYRGIMRFAASRPDWQMVIDPQLAGALNGAGPSEYDGIVGRIDQKLLEETREANIPVVNHWMNTTARNAPSVYPDYHACGKLVAEHLLARGFRKLGYMTHPSDRARPSVISGLREVLDDRGFQLFPIEVPFYFEGSRSNFLQFMSQTKEWLTSLEPPVGLYITNAAMGIYTLQACRELGLDVPNDFGIVSYNHYPTINLTSNPSLSALESDNERIGFEAASLLHRLMSGQCEEPAEPILVAPLALRARGSSDAIVSSDPIVAQAMRFIANHAKEPIRIEDVAKATMTSKRTLERRFQDLHDRPVGAEISRLRTETIKRILVDTDQQMSKIAEECGFASTSHFSSYFRKQTGMSPRQYRTRQVG